MHINDITLTNFRSYAQLSLVLEPGLVVFTGANGAGKTNLLEAISLLAPGRGLRRAKVGEFAKVGAVARWAVNATMRTEAGETMLATGADPNAPEADRRVVLIEGQKAPQQDLAEALSIVWLTPLQDRLWQDTPGSRRRFFDQLVTALHPPHAAHLARYEEALAERNRLLKEGRFDAGWLTSLEHILATEGMAVASGRRELVMALNGQFTSPSSKYYPAPTLPHPGESRDPGGPPWIPAFAGMRLGGMDLFPTPHLALTGVENWLDAGPALLAEDRLRDELARNRTIDMAAGLTTLGPHRSDFTGLYAAKNMPASLCSTGEQKALLISLVLAHAALIRQERGAPPILLLDEVAAHLDPERRQALFSALLATGSQAFLTGADPHLFDTLRGTNLCYKIEAGAAHQIAPA